MVDYTGEYQYGQTRMTGSVALVKGVPRYITDVGKDGRVYFNSLSMGTEGSEELKHLNNSELPLGFVNNPNSLHYVVRKPTRQWKQGVRRESLLCLLTKKQLQPNMLGFSETMMGLFPVIGDCLEMIECGERKSVAFCNSYAISTKVSANSFTLLHRNFTVGSISLSKYNVPQFSLKGNYEFLSEELEGAVQHV
jgi:hypothetical protein